MDIATATARPAFVESTANKPDPGRLVPIARLFLLAPTPLPKVRLVGRLLAVDNTTGWLLLLGGYQESKDSPSAVWVDIGVCQAGDGHGLAGVLAREGLGSCWMALGELDEVTTLPGMPISIPLGLSDSLSPTPDRVLRAIILRPVDDRPPGAGPFDLRAWEAAAESRFILEQQG